MRTSTGARCGEVITASKSVRTIGEDADVSAAVDLMIHRRIKRLPVLRGGMLSSASSRTRISSRDSLAAQPRATGAHPDAEIKAAIQAELDKLGWAPRASVRVEVKQREESSPTMARSLTSGCATNSR